MPPFASVLYSCKAQACVPAASSRLPAGGLRKAQERSNKLLCLLPGGACPADTRDPEHSLLPQEPCARAETLSWLFFQTVSRHYNSWQYLAFLPSLLHSKLSSTPAIGCPATCAHHTVDGQEGW